ncbi:MAG: hypothetical protein VXX63_00540, partial [Bacteroidota bacterium]|nr:hypothetical protein [Bacteroidota bacterium]
MGSGEKIIGSDSIIPIGGLGNVIFQRNDSTYDLIGGYDSIWTFGAARWYYPGFTGYKFDTLSNVKSGIYRHSITSSEGKLRVTDKNQMLLPLVRDGASPQDISYIFELYNVHRRKDFEYSALFDYWTESWRYEDTFSVHLAQIQNGKIIQVTKVELNNPVALFKGLIPIPPANRVYRPIHTYGGVQTLRGDKLFFLNFTSLAVDTFGREEDIITSRGIWSVDLEKNGALVSAPVEHQHIQNPYLSGGIYPTLNGVYRSFSDLTISPNDSILYYIENTTVYDSVGNTQRKTKQSIVKYWKFRDAGNNPQDLFSSPYGLNLNITPYGDLTISYTKSEET